VGTANPDFPVAHFDPADQVPHMRKIGTRSSLRLSFGTNRIYKSSMSVRIAPPSRHSPPV
jgi:hypothetical protein